MSSLPPDIPALPSSVPTDVRRAFDAIRTWFKDVRKSGGFVPDPSQSGMTSDDVEEVIDQVLPPGSTDYTQPPAIDGITATGAFRAIIITWTKPVWVGFAYVEVWRSTDDNLGNALLVGTTMASAYADIPANTAASVTYWYWVRIVSKTGQYGPHAGGVSAHTSLDPDYILDNLNGQITSSELHSSLNERIDLIDATGGILDRIGTNEANISSALEQLGTLTSVPFDSADAYSIGDLVQYGGNIYRCILATTPPSPLPTNATYWDLVGEYASLAEMVSAQSTALTYLDTRVSSVEGTTTALATDVTALEADVADIVSDVSANAVAIDATIVRVTASENSITSQAQSVTVLSGRLTTAEGAIANYSGAISSIEADVSAIDGIISSHGSAITQLDSRIEDTETGLTAASGALNELDTRVTSSEDGLTAQALQIAGIESDVSGNAAAIVAESQTRADETEALASQINALQAEVDGNSAAIATESETRADETGALADQIVTIQAIVGDNSAAIATEQEVRALTSGPDWSASAAYATGAVVQFVVGGAAGLYQSIQANNQNHVPTDADWWKPITANLYAQYMVKTDVNGYVAGFGMANDGITSEFLVRADIFAVGSPGVNGVYPFVVDVETGAVVMDTAVIKDGTITDAHIGTLSVDKLIAGGTPENPSVITAALIPELEAEKITSGTFRGINFEGGTFTGVDYYTNSNTSGYVHISATLNRLEVVDGNGVVRIKLGSLL